jgi:hypothetical protein
MTQPDTSIRTRGETVQVKCACCPVIFTARVADRKRGWGKFCSKSCKAKKQEQRTGQHAAYRHRQKVSHFASEYGGEPQFDRSGDYVGFTAGFSNEEHDCNKD